MTALLRIVLTVTLLSCAPKGSAAQSWWDWLAGMFGSGHPYHQQYPGQSQQPHAQHTYAEHPHVHHLHAQHPHVQHPIYQQQSHPNIQYVSAPSIRHHQPSGLIPVTHGDASNLVYQQAPVTSNLLVPVSMHHGAGQHYAPTGYAQPNPTGNYLVQDKFEKPEDGVQTLQMLLQRPISGESPDYNNGKILSHNFPSFVPVQDITKYLLRISPHENEIYEPFQQHYQPHSYIMARPNPVPQIVGNAAYSVPAQHGFKPNQLTQTPGYYTVKQRVKKRRPWPLLSNAGKTEEEVEKDIEQLQDIIERARDASDRRQSFGKVA